MQVPSPEKSRYRNVAFCLSGGSGLFYFFFTLAFAAANFKSIETSRFNDASIFEDLRSPRATRLTYEGSTPNLSATRL
jgi:hypothetical protein